MTIGKRLFWGIVEVDGKAEARRKRKLITEQSRVWVWDCSGGGGVDFGVDIDLRWGRRELDIIEWGRDLFEGSGEWVREGLGKGHLYGQSRVCFP